MDKDYIWLFEKYGWKVECFSPPEIRHEDGSVATGQAVAIILDDLKIQEGLTEVRYI